MKCINHPDREAVYQCAKCKSLLCEECKIIIGNGQAVICQKCLGSLNEPQAVQQMPNIIINNDNHTVNTNTNVNRNTNANVSGVRGKPKNKWVALLLCIFLGMVGGHKFYEEKFGMGILYLCTGGLFFIGIIVDILALLGKPTTYYI
jgi:hypothetical protein